MKKRILVIFIAACMITISACGITENNEPKIEDKVQGVTDSSNKESKSDTQDMINNDNDNDNTIIQESKVGPANPNDEEQFNKYLSELTADTADGSGTFGDNINWYYKDKVLIVTGTGEISLVDSETPDYKAIKNNVELLIIGNGITSIDFELSSGFMLENASKVILPNGLTELGERAFSEFTKLTDITIPDSVLDIRKNAFTNCGSLKSITIPSSVNTIEGEAFWGCTSLEELIIPEGVTNIDTSVCGRCSNLVSVTLPKSLAVLGHRPFEECYNLKNIYYAGTKEQWEEIRTYEGGTHIDNSSLAFPSGAELHYN